MKWVAGCHTARSRVDEVVFCPQVNKARANITNEQNRDYRYSPDRTAAETTDHAESGPGTAKKRKQECVRQPLCVAIQVADQVSRPVHALLGSTTTPQPWKKQRALLPQVLTVKHRIPLNDDAQEKAQRSHGRKALHEAQINQLKAAAGVATPARKGSGRDSLDHASPGSNPRTPRVGGPAAGVKENMGMLDDDEVDGGARFMVGGTAVTPMKRVPILANFEEWMKMATDNKINAANSWNFALIDYFHDMSLLKEGDGVNFQKASCTLDGCVKIYTSRVDSVATETGKLLSGLADSRDSKKKDRDGEEGEEEEEEEVDEDGNVRKKPKKKVSKQQTRARIDRQVHVRADTAADPAICRSHSCAVVRLFTAEKI